MDREQSAQLKVNRPSKTLRQLAYENLREAIFNSIFKPGERLVERELCAQLDVSRTVVREALRQLEAEGLVESIVNQGPIVARLDADRAEEIYEIRALLEGFAARACVANASNAEIDQLGQIIDEIDSAFEGGDATTVLSLTNRFYEQFFQVARKPFTWDMVQALNARISQLRFMTIRSPERHSAAIGEMHQILNAIRNRDADGAEAACLAHIQTVAAIADRLLRQDA